MTKTEAMDRVERNANDDWKTQAYTCVIGCAVRHEEFSTDDVWKRLTELWRAKTHEPRAMGAVMRQAARDGAITKTDRVRPSIMRSNNQRPVAIWRSRLYRDGGAR